MEFSKQLWDEILKQNPWNRTDYKTLRPDDLASLKRTIDFGLYAEFTGLSYKATRGYSEFPYHHFSEYPGIKPRVFMNFDFEGKNRSFEMSMCVRGFVNMAHDIMKVLGHNKWVTFDRWTKPGAIMGRYLMENSEAQHAYKNFRFNDFNAILHQDIEVESAKQAVGLYAKKHSVISKKFRNSILNLISSGVNPESDLNQYIELGSMVKSLSGEKSESEFISLVRKAYKSRDEFALLTPEDKSEILSLARMSRVHKP